MGAFTVSCKIRTVDPRRYLTGGYLNVLFRSPLDLLYGNPFGRPFVHWGTFQFTFLKRQRTLPNIWKMYSYAENICFHIKQTVGISPICVSKYGLQDQRNRQQRVRGDHLTIIIFNLVRRGFSRGIQEITVRIRSFARKRFILCGHFQTARRRNGVGSSREPLIPCKPYLSLLEITTNTSSRRWHNWDFRPHQTASLLWRPPRHHRRTSHGTYQSLG